MGKQNERSKLGTSGGKPCRRSRKWPWVLAGMLVLMVLIVLLIPIVLSSHGFARWLGSRISSSTGGQANIGDLSVGWFRGVRVADFSFRGPDGWTQVDIDRITTQPNLAGLFNGSLGLERTVIDQPRVAIDLRHRPSPAADGEPASIRMDDLARLNDVVVNNGSIQLTDTQGKTTQLADFDSTLSLRPTGRTSKFNLAAVVAQDGTPARIEASGQVTPNSSQGWSLKGTTGDLTVEVNDLNLNSVAPFLEMAGVQVQAQGVVSAHITGAVQDGRIENLNATVKGQNVNVTGNALKGDRIQTSQLNAKAGLKRNNEVISIHQLDVQTDWAKLSATGTLPTTVQSMAELLKGGSAFDLKGKFDIDMAAVLSQMPNTVGVQEGMRITGGRATGTITTHTEGARAVLVAAAQIVELAGTANGEKVALSQPVQANLRYSTNDQGAARLEGLDVTAPFAEVSAAGSFEQIQYKGRINLAALQSELGPFVNLGGYKMAGQAASEGRVSIREGFVGVTGSLAAQQLVLTTPDGNSVSEPQADVSFALGINQKEQVLAVETLSAKGGFGTIDVAKTTIPLGENQAAPLNVAVSARDVNLGAVKPYAVVFASFPREMGIEGVAQSQVNVTRENGMYRIVMDRTQIQNFAVTSPDANSFGQPRVTAMADVLIDPSTGGINVAQLQVDSPQIKIRKGTLSQVTQGNTARLQGEFDAEWDWAAVGQVASAFVPGTLDIAGQRQIAINFASTYPADDPNGMLAHLHGKTTIGFDRAEYMGMGFGPTQIDVQIENGQMQIEPFTTTVNNGRLSFAGQADLRQTPILLKTPASMQVAQGIQITPAMVDAFLKYVNPIFADAVGVSGMLDFETQSVAIPLTAGYGKVAQLAGTIGIRQLRLEASLLNKILAVIKESVRDQVLTIQPTKLALQNGVMRYDDMQIDAGDNPINFSGAIGLDGILDMTVLLPYTYRGETVRIGDQGQTEKRIAVPLTGSLSNPQIDLRKLFEGQLREQIFGGLEKLLKDKRK